MGDFIHFMVQCEDSPDGVCSAMKGCMIGCGKDGSYECGKSCWMEYVEGD